MRKPYQIAYKEMRRKRTFLKGVEVRRDLGGIFPEKNDLQIRSLVNNCVRYVQKGIKLKPEAEVVMEYLDQRRLCPRTVYRWLQSLIVPEDLRVQAEKGMLNKGQLSKAVQSRKIKEKTAVEWRFMEEYKRTIKEVIMNV